MELLTQCWLRAPDGAGQVRIATVIQRANYTQAPTATLGHFQIPTVWWMSLTGKLEATGPMCTNIRRG